MYRRIVAIPSSRVESDRNTIKRKKLFKTIDALAAGEEQKGKSLG
jgi:hypothetical protein